MKHLILLSILLLMSTSNESYYIEGKRFKGYVFGENKFVLVSIKDQKARYTPSEEDILKAEQLLNMKLKFANEKLEHQMDGCPVIHRKLKKYFRQYVGFLNCREEKVVWINFIWDKNLEVTPAKEIIQAQDGCSYYWSIKINLCAEELSDLSINGFA